MNWTTITPRGFRGSVGGENMDEAIENARAAGYVVVDVTEYEGAQAIVVADDDDPEFNPDIETRPRRGARRVDPDDFGGGF